jgi:hypothetical protein
MPERLARVDVREMNFDDRAGQTGQGVAQR